MDYYIFWIDKYTKGYRAGASHAVKDGEGKTVCGIKMKAMQWDGGYHSIEELNPECKKCNKALVK